MTEKFNNHNVKIQLISTGEEKIEHLAHIRKIPSEVAEKIKIRIENQNRKNKSQPSPQSNDDVEEYVTKLFEQDSESDDENWVNVPINDNNTHTNDSSGIERTAIIPEHPILSHRESRPHRSLPDHISGVMNPNTPPDHTNLEPLQDQSLGLNGTNTSLDNTGSLSLDRAETHPSPQNNDSVTSNPLIDDTGTNMMANTPNIDIPSTTPESELLADNTVTINPVPDQNTVQQAGDTIITSPEPAQNTVQPAGDTIITNPEPAQNTVQPAVDNTITNPVPDQNSVVTESRTRYGRLSRQTIPYQHPHCK